jgi:hypothetical protein
MGSLLSFTSSSGSFAGCLASGSNYFNSPQFILTAGYTYSASMLFWQSSDVKMWDKVALHLVLGSNQNVGIVASGTDFSSRDTVISGTFSVVNSGTYHIGVQTVKTSGTPSPFSLSFFDDLRIDCANMVVQSPTMICLGEDVQISAFSALSYTFQNSNGPNYDNPYSDRPLTDETYTVSGLIYGNCIDKRIIQVKVDECLGVKENKLTAGVYPNPFHDRLTLQTERPSGEIAVFDLLGNKIYSRNITNISTEIELKDLTPGIYVLRHSDGTYQSTTKLVCTGR